MEEEEEKVKDFQADLISALDELEKSRKETDEIKLERDSLSSKLSEMTSKNFELLVNKNQGEATPEALFEEEEEEANLSDLFDEFLKGGN